MQIFGPGLMKLLRSAGAGRACLSWVAVVCPLLLLLLSLTGCEAIGFYTQAARGQWQLLRAREPIDEVLARASADSPLGQRLQLVEDVRRYAARELALPVDENFSTYADLDRPYVIWNVFAAPELSVQPKTWCYPIAGCVSYRGYFSQQAAEAKAAQLGSEGYEVYVGGVRAYSTLGWFDDSVLSTYVLQSEAVVAGLIFHELAHQVVYVKNDTAFNESFAQSVEQLALQQYFADRQADAGGNREHEREYENYRAGQQRQREFTQLLLATRNELDTLFASDKTIEAKRAEKQRVMKRLAASFATLKASWNNDARYDVWMQNVNNARLATIADYHQWTGAFRALHRRSDGWADFYARVRQLAQLQKAAREQALRELQAQDASTPQ